MLHEARRTQIGMSIFSGGHTMRHWLHSGMRILRLAPAFAPAMLSTLAFTPAHSDTLEITVLDSRTGAPVTGAYVQVGPGPGDPFVGNWTWSDGDGKAVFDSPFLVGHQTVTAGAGGYSLLSVIEAAEGSITLRLHADAPSAGLPGQRAEVRGQVDGIEARSYDGYIDVGIVYPTVSLSSLLFGRELTFEVPSDTVYLPLAGPSILPGNIVIPGQTEYMFMRFSRPQYRFFIPTGGICDVFVASGRVPLSSLALGGISLDAMTMRSAGVRRGVHVQGDTELMVRADIPLVAGLEVSMPGAPPGSEVFFTSVADLPGDGAVRSLFFDAKTASADTLGSLVLAGLNPSGDLADAVPYVAGYYSDSSPARLFQAGIVDRTPLTLPASRRLDSLYRIPDVLQFGDEFAWGDVTAGGAAADPTWAVSTFRLQPEDHRAGRTLWEVWAPAAGHGFRLPILDPAAPGGLLDPGITPHADRLLWDLWIADPSGGVEDAMEGSFATLTRWSRRTVEASPPIASVEEIGLGTVRGEPLRFRLAPNPGMSDRDILWESPPGMGDPVAWDVVDVTGRRLMGGLFPSSGSTWDRLALRGTERLTTGVYWVRLRTVDATGTVPMIVLR